MNRIRPKEVVDAYISTGMGLIQKHFRHRESACGLGVVTIQRKCIKPCCGTLSHHYATILNLSKYYTGGFTWGFDNIVPLPRQTPTEFIIGWHDGRLAYLYSSGKKEFKERKEECVSPIIL